MENITPKIDKRAEKLKNIAECAFDLFLTKGYTNTKIIDIAEKCSMGKGTFYEYFKSKEELLLFVLENKIVSEYAKITDYVNESTDVYDKLRRYLDFEAKFLSKFGTYCNDVRIQFMEMDNKLSNEIFTSVSRLIQIHHDTVYSIVVQGIETGKFRKLDPTFVTNCICGMSNAFVSHSKGCPHYNGPDMMTKLNDEYNDMLFSLITDGIRG